MLYKNVADTIRKHLDHVSQRVASSEIDGLLQNISTAWSEHTIAAKLVCEVLMYMDKNYILPHKKPSVYNTTVSIFREVIFYHSSVRDRVRGILLDNIDRERKGLMIDKDRMKTVLRMLGELSVDRVDVYQEDFETPFLETTRKFYRLESQEFLSQNSIPAFMGKAEDRLAEEAARIRNYLSSTTEPKLKHLMDTEYISRCVRLNFKYHLSRYSTVGCKGTKSTIIIFTL